MWLYSRKGKKKMVEYYLGMDIMKMMLVILAVVLLQQILAAEESAECSTVTDLLSACYGFIRNGSPDPLPDSPCCSAISTLNTLSGLSDNHHIVCKCLMEIITSNNPNATAIATLPGFCGVNVGFTIEPNTDCEYIQ